MEHSHWYIVATIASGLNISLIIYLIKRASDQGKEFRTSIESISIDVSLKVDKAIDKFDRLCLERQASCAGKQDVKTTSMCQKLSSYAAHNDRQWEELTRRREQAWKRHEEQMEKIWETIRTHSHDR